MNQPFAELARQLLEVQVYPDLREYPEGPPEQPYDAAGWTLPLQMGVTVVEARTPLSAEAKAALKPLGAGRADVVSDDVDRLMRRRSTACPAPASTAARWRRPSCRRPARSPAADRRSAIDPAQNNAFRAVNARVEGGRQGPRRSPRRPLRRHRLAGRGDRASWSSRWRCRPRRTAAAGTELPRPRIGLYQPWTASMDAGWTQWLLENYGFEFSAVRPADVKAGALAPALRRADPRRRERALAARRLPGRRGAAAVPGRHGQRRRAGARPVRQGRRHARLHERQQQLRHRAAEAAGEERRRGRAPGSSSSPADRCCRSRPIRRIR